MSSEGSEVVTPRVPCFAGNDRELHDEETLLSSSNTKSVEDVSSCCGECSHIDDNNTLKQIDDFSSNESDSCSSCSTRRNSVCDSSDFEIALTTLFRTPNSSYTPSDVGSLINSPSRTPFSDPRDGIDLLLQRINSERFTELSNLQISNRPVTGGYARENIETFFRRVVHGLTEEERIQEDAENRPTHVTNDVQSLQQQSLVQSTLHNDFRNILEQTLAARQSPSVSPSVNNIPQIRQRRNLVGDPNFRSRLESLFSGQSSGSETVQRRPVLQNRTTEFPPRPQNTPTNTSTRTYSQVPTPPPRPYTPQPPTLPQVNAATPPRVNNDGGNTQNFDFAIQAGLELLAQNITEDLNRLQSLQVVSSMMRTDFRGHLENMMQDRVSSMDANGGARVQQFIQTLPRRQRPAQQMSPAGSAYPQSQVYPQSQAAINSGVSLEINSLRRQLDEMKRMLAMSMEIQMDTQRAVRQEVSAVFSTFMQVYPAPRAGETDTTSTTVQPPRSVPMSSGQCVICIERNVDTVLYHCGHMCVCNQCGLQLKMDGHNCPMCRAPIRDVIRAYQTQ